MMMKCGACPAGLTKHKRQWCTDADEFFDIRGEDITTRNQASMRISEAPRSAKDVLDLDIWNIAVAAGLTYTMRSAALPSLLIPHPQREREHLVPALHASTWALCNMACASVGHLSHESALVLAKESFSHGHVIWCGDFDVCV